MEINRERLIQTFLDLVQIDSESGEEQEIIAYLKKEMDDLGFETEIDKIGNLICSNDPKPKLMLAAHTDTVKPGKNVKPIIEGNIIKTDGTTVLGGDDKADVATILEILRIFKENQVRIPLEVIFIVGEEIWMVGSKGLDYSKIKSPLALNLDAQTGEIVAAAPSITFFKIEITGRAAHSGTEPEKGIDALKIAAASICKLDLGRIDSETTANIGVIKGGEAVNIVPEKVLMEAEIRSRNEEKFNHYVSKLIETFENTVKEYGGEIKIESRQEASAYTVPEDDILVITLKECCQKNGITPDFKAINGVSDANVFRKNGIKCISTGTVGKDYHTTREYLEIDKFVTGTKVILDAVLELTK